MADSNIKEEETNDQKRENLILERKESPLFNNGHQPKTIIHSQEVVRCPTRHIRLSLSWSRIELHELRVHGFIKFHDGSLVTAPVTVVRRAEDSYDLLFMGPVVALHNQLVSARSHLEAICEVELRRDILSEGVTRTARADAPACALVGIGPQKIAHGTFVGDLLEAIEAADLVEGVDGGRETAMETENLVLDECCERKVIEEVGEVLPDVLIAVFAHALLVETVNLSDGPTFVVSAEQSDAGWVPYLQGDHQRHCFDAVVTAVDVIAEEEVVCIWKLTADAEELQKIVELTVHITSDRNRAAHRLYIVLLYQDLLCLLAKKLDFGLCYRLALEQLRDDLVDIHDSPHT